jgi:hypothetical protein
MTQKPKTTRPRGFINDWSPHRKTQALIAQVQGVVADYADYLPMTLRQVFYRLVATHDYPKDEGAYGRLGELVQKMRRASLLDWNAIRDDGAAREWAHGYATTADALALMQSIAAGFRFDRQQGQPVRLMVMCEAAGMAPMLAGVANDYGIDVLSGGGFDSVTAKYDLAREIADAGVPVEILHIGDHDPSGVHIASALSEDLSAFCNGMGAEPPRLTRLAVTPEQVVTYGLPTAPPKPGDRRAFTGETTQAEALPPDTLCAILRGAIEARRDHEAAAATISREADAREELLSRLGA